MRRPRRIYGGDLPTARITLRTKYVRVLVFCNSCRHLADADLQKIVESGRGDVPPTELRFRCSQCGTDRTDFVVTSRDNPKPW
jgi:transposase-like protein